MGPLNPPSVATTASTATRYFHGSYDALAVGTVMSGRGADYEKSWANTDFYAVLERFRPDGMLAHKDAVFMVCHPDDIDLAGGATEWSFELKPSGPVSRHDLNWSSAISMLKSEGADPLDPEVEAAAQAYWRGDPHPDESVWEFLTASAVIVRCEPYETFAVQTEPAEPPPGSRTLIQRGPR